MVTDGILVTAMNTAPWFLAKCVYVTMLTIFLLAWRQRYAELLILLPVKFENRLRMARICRDVKSGVSGYLFTLSLINAGLAVITALCFWAAGIADPVLWGIAFGLLNFIPILGPTTVIGAAAIVGFATGNTIADALVPPAILLAINVVEANLVQPWLLSRRIVISPVAVFITAVAAGVDVGTGGGDHRGADADPVPHHRPARAVAEAGGGPSRHRRPAAGERRKPGVRR